VDASGSTARRHNTSVDTAESVFCLDHGWSLQGAAARSRKATASTSAIQTPHASLRGQIPIEPAAPPAPTSRDFVPWRFSDAGGRSPWMPSSCRRPRNLHNNRLGPHRTIIFLRLRSPSRCEPMTRAQGIVIHR
jgi:hypothetical protein